MRHFAKTRKHSYRMRAASLPSSGGRMCCGGGDGYPGWCVWVRGHTPQTKRHPPSQWTEEITHTCENITFPQLLPKEILKYNENYGTPIAKTRIFGIPVEILRQLKMSRQVTTCHCVYWESQYNRIILLVALLISVNSCLTKYCPFWIPLGTFV